MTKQEAADISRELGERFANVTAQQAKDWYEFILPHRPDAVREAIKRHYFGGNGLLNPANLKELVHSEVRKREHVSRAKQMAENQELERQWSKIDTYIGDLDREGRLDALATIAIDGVPEPTRSWLAKRDPRKSAVLKGMIYELAKSMPDEEAV